MAHEEIHPHYHKHVMLWLTTGFVALCVLLLMAWVGKDKGNFRIIPEKTRITPTPIISGNITVNEPYAEAHVSQEFFVTGTSTLPLVGIRLRDKYSGHVIIEGITKPNAGKYVAPLKITSDTIRSEAPLILEIFEPVGANQENNKITLPLTFTPVGN